MKISSLPSLCHMLKRNIGSSLRKDSVPLPGLSMGGGGSFMYALHHPELFSSACPLSAYIGPLNVDELKKRLASDNPNISDDAVLKYYQRHSALAVDREHARRSEKSSALVYRLWR